MARDNLKNARQNAGLTQEQVAERIGISKEDYSKIESGECLGEIKMWDALEDMFHIHQRILRSTSKSEFIRTYPNISKFIRVRKSKSKLSRLEFILLAILQSRSAVAATSSMTLKEIADTEDLGYKENTLSKKIREFQKGGLVERGLKEGHADTFYITPKGIALLENERKQQEENR